MWRGLRRARTRMADALRVKPAVVDLNGILKMLWPDSQADADRALREYHLPRWESAMRAWPRLAPFPGRDRNGRRRAPRPPMPAYAVKPYAVKPKAGGR